MSDESARETFAKVMESAQEAPSEAPQEAVATEEVTEAVEAVGQPSAERARDESGRFVAKETVEEPEDVTEAVPDEEIPEADEDTNEDGGEEVVSLDPPPQWTLEDQERFRAQPVEVQQFLLDRDKELARVQSEMGETRKQYSYLEEIMTPDRVSSLQMIGQTPQQYLSQLVALSDYAGKDKPGFARWFAGQHGLTVNDIFPDAQPVGDETEEITADPQVAALQERLVATERQLQQFTGQAQQQQASQQTAQEAEAARLIDDFRTKTDERGQPLHPYFAEVEGQVATFLQAGQAETLEAAYDMAVHANPATRAKLEAAQRAAADREAERERRAKAKEARKAGSSITGTPAGTTAATPPANARDHLARLARESGLAI